jgi:hypothetical protein
MPLVRISDSDSSESEIDIETIAEKSACTPTSPGIRNGLHAIPHYESEIDQHIIDFMALVKKNQHPDPDPTPPFQEEKNSKIPDYFCRKHTIDSPIESVTKKVCVEKTDDNTCAKRYQTRYQKKIQSQKENRSLKITPPDLIKNKQHSPQPNTTNDAVSEKLPSIFRPETILIKCKLNYLDPLIKEIKNMLTHRKIHTDAVHATISFLINNCPLNNTNKNTLVTITISNNDTESVLFQVEYTHEQSHIRNEIGKNKELHSFILYK